MIRLRLAAAAFVLAGLPAFADDPKPDAPKSNPAPADRGKITTTQPSQYHPAGVVAGKVKSVSGGGIGGGTITISAEVVEQARNNRGRLYLKRVDKEVDYDLADDVKFRFGFRPKSPAAPDKLPGYKAESSDVHSGQIVKLTLGKKASPGGSLNAAKPVVTMVTIETDTPAKDDKKDKKN
jgi:hypothetical protein